MSKKSSIVEGGKFKEIELTMQEIWMHTLPRVHKSKKQYIRKPKHKTKNYG